MNIDNIKATTDAFLDCNLDEYSFCERLKLQRRLIIEIERTVSSMRCEPNGLPIILISWMNILG